MKKVFNFLLKIVYGTKAISFNDFASSVAEIAEKYNKSHWKVTTSMDAFGDTSFSGYVTGHWTTEHKTPEEVIHALVKHCTTNPDKNLIEDVFINNTNTTTTP